MSKTNDDRVMLQVELSRDASGMFDRVAERLCAEAGVNHTRSNAVRIAIKRLASQYNVIDVPRRKRAPAASVA